LERKKLKVEIALYKVRTLPSVIHYPAVRYSLPSFLAALGITVKASIDGKNGQCSEKEQANRLQKYI
jgi:hypothetical protein